MAMFGFNNNMFGNRRSLTPSRSAIAVNPSAGVNSPNLGYPKAGVRPTGFPYPTPNIQIQPGTPAAPQMSNGMAAFQPDAPTPAPAPVSQPGYSPSASRVRGMNQGPLGRPMVGPPAPGPRPSMVQTALNTPSIRQSTLDQFDQTDRAMQGMEAMVGRLTPGAQNIRGQQQSLMQQLNRPVDRSRVAAAGGTTVVNPDALNPANPNGVFPNRMGGLSPRMNTSEAANVLRGQAPGSNTAMRPLNIPGMVYDEANGRMIPQSQVPRASTADQANAGLGGMTPNQFREAQSTGVIPVPFAQNGTAGTILARQQAAKNSDVIDGKQYSPADWQARAERQSLRRAFTDRGGRGRAGFNNFVNNYYNQNGGSGYYNDQFGPGDRQASQQAAYRILRPGAVDMYNRVGSINATPAQPSFAEQQKTLINPVQTTLQPPSRLPDLYYYAPPTPEIPPDMPVQGFFRRPSFPGVRGNRTFPG